MSGVFSGFSKKPNQQFKEKNCRVLAGFSGFGKSLADFNYHWCLTIAEAKDVKLRLSSPKIRGNIREEWKILPEWESN